MNEDKENEVNNVESEVNQATNTAPANDKKGFSIAALVLGIIALVLCCIWYVSIPCGIIALTWNYRFKIKQKRNVNCRNYYRCYWYDTKYCISNSNCYVRCKYF